MSETMTRVVVKNFWSYDYDECNIQIPLLKDLQQRFIGRVVFVDICGNECKKDVEKYNIKTYPTIIIECDGQERERFIGLTQERFLQRAIQKVLSECK